MKNNKLDKKLKNGFQSVNNLSDVEMGMEFYFTEEQIIQKTNEYFDKFLEREGIEKD